MQQEIADAHGLQAFKLDQFFLMAKKTGLSGEALNDAARAMSLEYVSELIGAGNPCVVEGTWIRPAQAAGLIEGEAFHPVFCGFPNAEPKAHLKQIWAHYSESGHLHWLMGKDTDEALAFLGAQIEDSRRLRDECKDLGSRSSTSPSSRTARRRLPRISTVCWPMGQGRRLHRERPTPRREGRRSVTRSSVCR